MALPTRECLVYKESEVKLNTMNVQSCAVTMRVNRRRTITVCVYRAPSFEGSDDLLLSEASGSIATRINFTLIVRGLSSPRFNGIQKGSPKVRLIKLLAVATSWGHGLASQKDH